MTLIVLINKHSLSFNNGHWSNNHINIHTYMHDDSVDGIDCSYQQTLSFSFNNHHWCNNHINIHHTFACATLLITLGLNSSLIQQSYKYTYICMISLLITLTVLINTHSFSFNNCHWCNNHININTTLLMALIVLINTHSFAFNNHHWCNSHININTTLLMALIVCRCGSTPLVQNSSSE